ncbi:MAG TPA: hypothetical protein VE988_11830 [Gemmataceae bacterium]|nr:hypothetical protein [Gemmataceae bacterium]
MKKKNGITFGELRDLLLDVGFSELPQEQDRLRFEHPVSGTILLFRPHDPHEAVSHRDMVVVRRQLVDNGLMEGAGFDRFLEKASA